MEELELFGPEEDVIPRSLERFDYPAVTISPWMIYFNSKCSNLFPEHRIRISRAGQYIIFRGTYGSQAFEKNKKNNSGFSLVSLNLIREINPDNSRKSYKLYPVKGGGYAIKLY